MQITSFEQRQKLFKKSSYLSSSMEISKTNYFFYSIIMVHHICNMSEQSIFFVLASCFFPSTIGQCPTPTPIQDCLKKISFSKSTGKKNEKSFISEFFLKSFAKQFDFGSSQIVSPFGLFQQDVPTPSLRHNFSFDDALPAAVLLKWCLHDLQERSCLLILDSKLSCTILLVLLLTVPPVTSSSSPEDDRNSFIS